MIWLFGVTKFNNLFSHLSVNQNIKALKWERYNYGWWYGHCLFEQPRLNSEEFMTQVVLLRGWPKHWTEEIVLKSLEYAHGVKKWAKVWRISFMLCTLYLVRRGRSATN